ncbi:MAG: tetratricopeptide repeat protein [Bacteroidales bacterium]
MEEEKYGLSHDEEIKEVIQRFEKMKRNNENYFFDVVEFETIIDYYLESNNQARAYDAADMATLQHPNSVSIQLRKARVLLDKGRAVEALRILKRLEVIEPGNHEIYISKGTALGILGDIQGARKMFDHALSTDSEDTANILFAITSVLHNLNYYEQLIPYMIRLMELEPGFHAHKYDLAYAYEKIHDYTNAVKYYLVYIEEEPFSDSAWYNLGIIYNKLEQFQKALEAYDYALAINNQNSFALFNKGNILCNLERYDEAIPVYLEYLEYEPDSFEALTYLGECYDKTDNQSLSKKYYNEAIELAPEFPDPWIGLGILSMNNGDTSKSMIYFKKALKLDNENPEVWFLTGKIHGLEGDHAKAIQCFRESLKLDPFFSEVWIELGNLILNENLEGKALPLLEQAYKVTGDVPGINYLLAAFNLKRGDTETAAEHLAVALELDKELYSEFSVFFPENLLNRKIKDILKNKL